MFKNTQNNRNYLKKKRISLLKEKKKERKIENFIRMCEKRKELNKEYFNTIKYG